MAKKTETLEEGLNRSANKRGFTGKERHRYIGGALHNMGKAKTRSGKKEKVTTPRPAPKASTPKVTAKKVSTVAAHKPAPKPAPKPVIPEKPREKLVLEVKKNAAASAARGVPMYSLYKSNGFQHGSYVTKKRAAAVQEAKIEMDSYNHPKGIHTRGKLA